MIAYDPLALIDAGIYNLVPNPYGDVVVKSYYVKEKLLTPYIQANIRADVGASLLTGNVGVQAIFTDQRSKGASAIFLGTNPNGSPNIGATVNDSKVTYTDVLPSLNLSLRMPSDFVIRFALAREIIRSRLDDLRYSLSYGYSYVGPVGNQQAFVTGGSGNPALRPWRANAADLTFEKYWGSKGYIAAQFFWKDLKSYVYNQDVEVPVSSLVLAPPNPGAVVDPIAVINQPINGKGGKLYGVELAGTLPFETFSSALEGFGVTGGVSYTKSKIRPSPGLRRPLYRAIRSGCSTARPITSGTASTSAPAHVTGRVSSAKCRALQRTAFAGMRRPRRSSMGRSATTSRRACLTAFRSTSRART